MQIFRTIAAWREALTVLKQSNQRIGFVPTMGALHEGHLALIKQAKATNDVVVCSIFVNPTQFNNAQDLAAYPRMIDADSQLLADISCDFLFVPSEAEMYPILPQITFNFGILEKVMEGKFRPGHFSGVGVVVAKLFNIIQPNQAFFGLKDLQQCFIIRQLVNDLSFDLMLVLCPTFREDDGLAMSSRNRNLSPQQRAEAPFIYQMLQQAKKDIQNGEEIAQVHKKVLQEFAKRPNFVLEYFEIVQTKTLETATHAQQELALCVATFLGKTRLIDNVLVD